MKLERFMPLFDTDETGGTPTETTVETEVAQDTPSLDEIEIEYLGNKEKISLKDTETVKPLLQKGKNYDRIYEKWETTKPIMSKLEETARLHGYRDENGKGLIDEFLDTIEQNYNKSQIDGLVDKGFSEEDAKEFMELKKANEELAKFKEEQSKKEQKNKNELEFLEYFKQVNGRPFTDSDKIPNEVLIEESKGTPLKWAYADYIAKQSVLNQKIDKVNEDNEKTSSMSMKSTPPDDLSFTREQVESMTTEEVKKNYSKILQSMKKWK